MFELMTRKRQLKGSSERREREREGWQKKRRYACCFALVLLKLILFPRRWRICIHFSQRINKWEKIWSTTPSVCLKRDRRARGPIRGAIPWRQTSPNSFLEFVGFFSSARYYIISYTQEKNFGMIENSLDLTERRGRPWLEMRNYFYKGKRI